MAGSIQKTLEGESLCVCVCESKAALHCVEVDLWKEKKVGESGGRRVPKGYHHFIAQCPVVPPGLELIGTRLTFQWDIMTPSAPTHLWISDIGRGRFPCHALKVIIWSWTVWLPLWPNGTKIACS